MKTFFITVQGDHLQVRQGNMVARINPMSLIRVKQGHEYQGVNTFGYHKWIGQNSAYLISREANTFMKDWIKSHALQLYPDGSPAIKGHWMLPREQGPARMFALITMWYKGVLHREPEYPLLPSQPLLAKRAQRGHRVVDSVLIPAR